MTVSRRDVLKSAGCACGLSVFDLYPESTAAAAAQPAHLAATDQLTALPPQAVQLHGYLDHYIRLSIEKWSKGVVPYKALASFFSEGRPKVTDDGREVELFATGEMWGKAVTATALSYRYTGDPQLKALLKSTVADLIRMRRSNGTISCSPVEIQPDGPGGDVWERSKVLLALDDYYNLV